ncbi:Pentulose kinase [Vararia minispora EC-137]|uniref:Pentulose kinase n=1 Tax=Vararia minispora EC-137 TaxID=1314806 RepID=A0ACB8QSN8_9AGAM|nr:Pentulose kinase [Vararia minispora EC-137]
MSSAKYYIGVDVGTGSARAGLVRHDGTLVASSSRDITTWRDPQDHRIYEQSSTEIWDSIAFVVRDVLAEAKIAPADVKGLGFDATCSTTVTDFNGDPVSVTKGAGVGQRGTRNIMLWADHRAEKEAEFINSQRSIVLDYVGGTMSLEMEVPKILWLKKNATVEDFARCQFFDLPDFLTYRATGYSTRSVCSITCKESFVPSKGWQAEFFNAIGLPEIVQNHFRQMGAVNEDERLTAGTPVGRGLSKQAADELGLLEGTPVGSGLIDAYAGWMGTIAARHKEKDGRLSTHVAFEEAGHRLAAIAGTSTCHVVQSRDAIFVKGVWGPYKDPVFPGWWMNEGGQSSTGQLIDFMITTHAAYPELKSVAEQRETNIHQGIAETWTEMLKDLHFYPDLHGNRSPIADPRMRGSLVGMSLSATLHDLARKYAVTLEAIALQTRHIVDSLNAAGHTINSIYMSGSQAQNVALMQWFADACSIPIFIPHSFSVAVVLGSAILGRFAAEYRTSMSEEEHNRRLWTMMEEMTPPATVVYPAAAPKERKMLDAKYKIFLENIDIQKRWRQEMEDASK